MQPSNVGLDALFLEMPEAPLIFGWRIIGVFADFVLLDGGPLGVYEVGQGEFIPTVGRIDAIYRGSRGWVVATTQGIIVSD